MKKPSSSSELSGSRKLPEVEKILQKIRQIHQKIQNPMIGEYDTDYPENEYPELETPDLEPTTANEHDGSVASATYGISFIEMAIMNDFLYNAYKNGSPYVNITAYGVTDGVGRASFGIGFDASDSYWFMGTVGEDKTVKIFHTKIFRDSNGNLLTQLHISVRNAGYYLTLEKEMKSLLKIAFNNSQYKGKCLKVKLADGRFRGIEIIDLPKIFDLILTPIQEKYKNNFINRVRRGSSTRYLLNGTPGSGKTETIRDIIKQLVPEVTFVIPDFTNVEDLTTILEACEIFENAVIIMDDIDLFLGSREKGSYTRLLGEFLAFFDGVKKRSISLLASTNDKGLVDAAAERPGRFNLTLDYTYLTDEQIIKVCEIHLPVEYQKPEIYNAFKKIDGKKGKVTGAFIANLAENIKEMSFGDDNWGIAETIELIEDSYKGFYSSQIKKEEKVGFLKDN
jgi:hypothetical protein